ncbi:MAG: T9SS type A sorting domain-containing protein [Flavobacteriales bacterium]|nr:T9SS type A sorting domain-containing protein [Flavobacteriales bacterium]
MRLPILFAGAALLCAAGVNAQLVFIPDVQLRAWFNNTVPGSVNAGGFLDTSLPALAAVDSVEIDVTWYPSDMTGIEYLIGLDYLKMMFPYGQGTASIPAFPPAVEQLWIETFGGTSLPAFPPNLLRLHLNALDSITQLPALPNGLDEVLLIGMGSLTEVPALPASLNFAQLEVLPQLTTPIVLPAGLDEVRLGEMPVAMFPAMPDGLRVLYLYSLYELTTFTDWPESLESFVLGNTGITSIGPFPNGLREIQFWTGIEEVVSFPDSLRTLRFDSWGGFNVWPECLPMLPDSMELLFWDVVVASQITCLPNIPANPDFVCVFCPMELCTVYNSTCPNDNAVVSGTVYRDLDSDGAEDAGEPPLPGTVISIGPGFMTSTDTDGRYSRAVANGTYTITATHPSPYFTGTLPTTHSAVLAAPGEIDSLNNFGAQFVPDVQDLIAELVVSPAPRPGFTNTVWLSCTNYGTTPVDASLSLTYEAAQSFVSSSIAPDQIAGQTLTWELPALQVGEVRSISVQLLTSVSTPLGTIFLHIAQADPLATDETPTNNVVQLPVAVVGSWDPNDKQVSPDILSPDDVADGKRVEYLVRFQNTGNFPADRVLVKDSLSAALEWSTFHFLGASHACTWFMEHGILFFEFNDIQLPDSVSNEPESHGFVRFSIVPSAGLVVGDVVPNSAAIYFDFNEPVITNDAVFSVQVPQGVGSASNATFGVHPNPVVDRLVLSVPGHVPVEFMIRDALGRLVQRGIGQGPQFVVPMDALGRGVYTVTITDGTVERIARIVKK